MNDPCGLRGSMFLKITVSCCSTAAKMTSMIRLTASERSLVDVFIFRWRDFYLSSVSETEQPCNNVTSSWTWSQVESWRPFVCHGRLMKDHQRLPSQLTWVKIYRNICLAMRLGRLTVCNSSVPSFFRVHSSIFFSSVFDRCRGCNITLHGCRWHENSCHAISYEMYRVAIKRFISCTCFLWWIGGLLWYRFTY